MAPSVKVGPHIRHAGHGREDASGYPLFDRVVKVTKTGGPLFVREQDRVVPRPACAAFFLSEGGSRLTEWNSRYTFAKVSRQVGLRSAKKDCRHGPGPRLYDMRHRFAACTMLNWYRAGIDVEREIPKLASYLGLVHVNDTYWHLDRGRPGAAGAGDMAAGKPEGDDAMNTKANFSALIQTFFTDRPLTQRRASLHIFAGYRDTFRLLLQFAAGRLGKVSSRLTLEELDAAFIDDFLDHLEMERRNSARSRNTRLPAIHAFFHCISFQEPASGEQCRRILAIPSKRYERRWSNTSARKRSTRW